MDWIRVSDELPIEKKLYLVYRNMVSVATFFPEHKCFRGIDPKFWMPLPEPPELKPYKSEWRERAK